jgi:hypothetical protein
MNPRFLMTGALLATVAAAASPAAQRRVLRANCCHSTPFPKAREIM